MSIFKEKLTAVENWANLAYRFAEENDLNEALNNGRKFGEAITKLIIYHEWGEVEGSKLINGEVDSNLNVRTNNIKKIDFEGLKRLVYNHQYTSNSKYERQKVDNYLEALQRYGNKGSHDNDNSKELIVPSDVVYCVFALTNCYKFIFQDYLEINICSKNKKYVEKVESYVFFEDKNSKLNLVKKIKQKKLIEQIDKTFSLIDEWNDTLRLNQDNPTYQNKCKAEIGRLSELAEDFERQYNKMS